MDNLGETKLATLEVDTANGDVILILNENGDMIGALTGEPNTGVERVLNALRSYQCPEHPTRSCITLARMPDSVLVVAKASRRDAIMRALSEQG
jgi:hypothetical protein